jgi:hypothetical protein
MDSDLARIVSRHEEYPVLERRDTICDSANNTFEEDGGSGTTTPLKIGGRGDATEFPVLEKRATNVGDEDEGVIL